MDDTLIEDAAQRHGLSAGAVRALWSALLAGGGRQAQFAHPDLGGMGQWSGGMVQIGDMFNDRLKAKVAGACADLAEAAAQSGSASRSPHREASQSWWPGDLGPPSSTGAQGGSRYAVFPDTRRLAIERDGRVTLYDTGSHRIFGVSQQQGTCSAMAFTSQDGPVMLDALPVVDQPAR